MEFDVVLEEDESGAWVADVPSLPGCHTQGATRDEVLDRIKEAIRLYPKVEPEIPPQRAITIERVTIDT